jgi:Lactate dehydrogenase and related dehydrogenases
MKIIYGEKPTETTKEFVKYYQKSGQEIIYLQELSSDEQDMALAEAECLIVATFPVTRELLAKMPKLKLVQRAGIGLDNVDMVAASEKGIHVCNTPGVNAVSVAEMTIGMILGLFRKIPLLDRATKDGQWLMWEYRPEMFEMQGKVHGILGMGNVGKEVAKRSVAFGTKILYTNMEPLSAAEEASYNASFSNLEEILEKSDIISVHVPLLPSTRNLIGEKEIAKMKPTAVLVNVARGNIIDEAAVAKALQEGRLLGAGFDAFAAEPPEADNPLKNCPNAILTPHVAGGTRDVLEAGIARCVENAYRLGIGEKPLHICNG